MARTNPTLESVLADAQAAARGRPHGFGAAMAHCAHSIDCSIDGYPRPAAWPVRVLIGPLLLKRFLRRGFMSHDTNAPVPGAPASDLSLSAQVGLERLEAAISRFRAHHGPLAPHFAYGPLDKGTYIVAHAMHVANHLDALKV